MSDLSATNNYKFERQTRIGIAVLQAAVVIFFLISMNAETYLGPTLDDSWIHYQFVTNMAELGEVSFNAGEWSTGTTSLMWNLLLVPGVAAGIPVMPLSIIIGILLYFILGQQVYSVFRTYWKNELNNAVSVLIVLITGNMVWYSLSGMETILFLVLGLWWIDAFTKEKWWLAGILAGALMLTRIEGLLFILMGLFLTVKRYRAGGKFIKPALIQVICSIPLMLPSFILNQIVTGKFYPTTMAGKKWLYGLGDGFFGFSFARTVKYVMSWIGTFYQNNWWPQMIDRQSTIQYPLLKLISKGYTDKPVGKFAFEPYPIWFQIFTVIAGIVLLLILLRGFYRVLRPSVTNFFKNDKPSAWELLIYWFIGHNLIYLLLMPIRGHGGRYQAVNFILAGLFMAAGTDVCAKVKNLKYKVFGYGLRPGVLLIYFMSIIAWGIIYAASVLHVNEVHVASGKWLRQNVPENTPVAVFDVGAIKYFSQLPVTDVAGLTDREALEYVLDGDVVPIMKKRNVKYLAMVENHPFREDVSFFSAFYDRLGIRKEIGVSLNLIPVAKFSIPREIWFRHWVALRTHSPVIAIYKIEWIEGIEENRQIDDTETPPRNRNEF